MRIDLRMFASLATLAAISVLPGVTPSPADAQGVQELDRGIFELRSGDRRVGSERFAVRRDGRDVRAVGEIRLDSAGTGGLRDMELGMRADEGFRPELFRARLARGDVQSVVAVREEGRLRVQVTSSDGDRWKEFLAPDDLSILDPRVGHHWYLLLRQHRAALEGAGRVRVPAVSPMERRRVELEIRRHGTEAVDLPGARRSAVRYTATLDAGEEVTVWTDEEGRIMKITMSSRDWTAVRLPGGTG